MTKKEAQDDPCDGRSGGRRPSVGNTMPKRPRCSAGVCGGGRCLEGRDAPVGCVREEVLRSTVILGLDPRIHKETGRLLVVRWIPGSSPGMTKTKKSKKESKKKAGG